MMLPRRPHPRTVAWTTLLFVALAPFVLVWCKVPVEATRPAVGPGSSSASASSEPARAPSAEPVITSSVAAPPETESSVPPETESSAPPASPPLPRYTGALAATCEALERQSAASFEDRACTTSADCAVAAMNCGCSRGLARRALPKFEALQEAYRKKDCFQRGPPKPCATCPPPAPPRCSAGKCS